MNWFTGAGPSCCWFKSYTLCNLMTTTQKQKIYKTVLDGLLCALDSANGKTPNLMFELPKLYTQPRHQEVFTAWQNMENYSF